MKTILLKRVVQGVLAFALHGAATMATAQGFNGVAWSVDNDMRVHEAEEVGCGEVPDPDSTGPLTFSLAGCESGKQRQEFKYLRRGGFHRMKGDFIIDEGTTDFSAIAVAQTHDNGKGSEGVFTIYRITKRDGQLYFSAQGDYFNHDEVEDQIIYPGRAYRFVTTTYSDGASSYEYGELYERGRRIWELWTTDGGADLDDESAKDASKQYKKIGAYQLSEGYGAISVEWNNVEFFTGRR